MKKLPLILVILIILAQLAWLSVQYDTLSFKLDNAPRILVKGTMQGRLAGVGVRAVTTRSQLRGDDPFFGSSLWWDAERWQRNVEAPEGCFTSRAKAHADSLELTPYSVQKLAGFWQRGEDGFWQLCRVAAPDSAEATCRPGEVHLPVLLHHGSTFTAQDSVELGLEFSLCTRGRSWEEYELPDLTESSALKHWEEQHPESPIALEIALRGNCRPPIITRLLVGGKPYTEMRPRILQEYFAPKKNTTPPPAEPAASTAAPAEPEPPAETTEPEPPAEPEPEPAG